MRGTTTALIQSIRRLDEYQEWKKQVHLRDRFTCQWCGRRNGRKRVIEAHHLKSLSELVREHQITRISEALVCAELWSVENGLTLCKTCHQQTDSYPKQFRKNASKNKPKRKPKAKNGRAIRKRRLSGYDFKLLWPVPGNHQENIK